MARTPKKKDLTSPLVLICVSWLTNYLLYSHFLTLTLATDSQEFTDSESVRDALTSKSPAYATILYLLKNSPENMKLLQAFLLLVSAILLFFTVSRLVSTKLSTFVTILSLFNPLIWFYCFLILTETISYFLVITFLYLTIGLKVSREPKMLFRLSILPVILLFSFALRANLTYFMVFFLILLFFRRISSIDVAQRLRFIRFISLFTVVVMVLQIFAVFMLFYIRDTAFRNFEKPLNTGIAMHLVQAVPAIRDSQVRNEFINQEFTIRQEIPSNQPWAIQATIQDLFPNQSQEFRESQAFQISKELLLAYPLIYLQSVFKTFFSTPISDIFSTSPKNSFSPNVVKLLQAGFLFINCIFFFFIFWTIIKSWNGSENSNDLSVNGLILALSNVAFIWINSIISPLEQLRYAFPIMPSQIMLLAFILQSRGMFRRF